MLHGILTHRRVSVCCPRVQLIAPDPAEIRLLRGHKLSVTCLVITPDEKHIFSASKDCSIIKCNYALKLFQKKKIPGVSGAHAADVPGCFASSGFGRAAFLKKISFRLI